MVESVDEVLPILPPAPLPPRLLVPLEAGPPELLVRGAVDTPVEVVVGDDELQAAVIIARTATAESTPARPDRDCMMASSSLVDRKPRGTRGGSGVTGEIPAGRHGRRRVGAGRSQPARGRVLARRLLCYPPR